MQDARKTVFSLNLVGYVQFLDMCSENLDSILFYYLVISVQWERRCMLVDQAFPLIWTSTEWSHQHFSISQGTSLRASSNGVGKTAIHYFIKAIFKKTSHSYALVNHFLMY